MNSIKGSGQPGFFPVGSQIDARKHGYSLSINDWIVVIIIQLTYRAANLFSDRHGFDKEVPVDNE